MKKAVIQTIKFALAMLLIGWLIRTEKITLDPFIKLWSTPWLTFFVFGVILLILVVNNYRWLLLLKGQKVPATVKQTLPLTFIGLFFNLAMPGSVGGDVIKAYYIAQEHPGTKLKVATSVLMDRVVGLYAMSLLAMIAVFAYFPRLSGSHHLRVLAYFDLTLVFMFTLAFMLGFSRRVRGHDWVNLVLAKIPGGQVLTKIYDTVHSYREGKRQFLLGILLGMIVHTMNVLMFYTVAVTLHYENVTLGAMFFIIPLGLIATAIPISPGGIGVGQAVFLALFNWYGGISQSLGPTLITISQVAQAIWSLGGGVIYFTRRAPRNKVVVIDEIRS